MAQVINMCSWIFNWNLEERRTESKGRIGVLGIWRWEYWDLLVVEVETACLCGLGLLENKGIERGEVCSFMALRYFL